MNTSSAPAWQPDFSASYPGLAKFADDGWKEIITSAQHVKAPTNTVLLEQGQICSGFILLLKGGVRVFQYVADGRELTLYRLEPGDICVMSLNSLLKDVPFAAVAKTETNIEALVLSPTQFSDALNSSQFFCKHILSRMTTRYCDMLTLVQETAFKRLDMRLACLLGRMFEKAQSDTLHITHQELAKEMGTTREVISRALKEMEHQECIHLARGQIQISSPEGLRGLQGD